MKVQIETVDGRKYVDDLYSITIIENGVKPSETRGDTYCVVTNDSVSNCLPFQVLKLQYRKRDGIPDN